MTNINKKEAFLESESGYMMPFAQSETEDTQILLPYGKQTNPLSGQEFEHQGIDFAVSGKPLYAMATGVIIGAGQEAVHENYIVAKYGNYEVTYGHIAEAYCPYGTKVQAGQVIAKSGNILHLGVRLGGQYIDPGEYLSMIYANIQNLAALGLQKMPTVDLDGKEIHTKYDDDKNEILTMMQRWLPLYLSDLTSGKYASPKRIEAMLRNGFQQAALRDYFFEKVPNVGNPLGLSSNSLPLVEKFQNLLLEDFLTYMATQHNVYPPSWNDGEKKNFLSPLPKTV